MSTFSFFQPFDGVPPKLESSKKNFLKSYLAMAPEGLTDPFSARLIFG